MSTYALSRSVAIGAIMAVLAACGSGTNSNPTLSSGLGEATATPSPSATSSSLTVVYQAINGGDHSIHDAVIHDSVISDHIVVNDATISFLLGFAGPSKIAVRKDPPGTGMTEIGTIDISTGAYQQVYSMVHSALEEMLGPELSPDGRYAAFEDQVGATVDWLVLDMTTGQTRSLNLTQGGALIAWSPAYILFNTGAGLIEVDPLTGTPSPVANSADYSIASPDGSRVAGAVYRNLGDPQWCLNTVVVGTPGGPENVAAAGKNRFNQPLDVANTGDMLFTQGACGRGAQAAAPDGNADVELWHSGQLIQQFPAEANHLWANAKFLSDSSALMQRDTLTQENTPDGVVGVVTASELDLVDICADSGCQATTKRLGLAQGRAAGYLYFAATE